MGTSNIYGGPIDKKNLLPSDYDELAENNMNEEPWKNTKKLMAKYITGSNSNLNGVVKNYIKALGGVTKATQNSKAGIESTINLGQIFSNIRENGIEKTFRELNIDYQGKNVNEILSELVNVISFASNKKEEIVAKNATIETLSEIYSFIEENEMDISHLESMNEQFFDVILCRYISSYIWEKMLNDLESRFEAYSSDPNMSMEIEEEFKGYIKSTVDVTYNKVKVNMNDFNNKNIKSIINSIYSECYSVLGGTI